MYASETRLNTSYIFLVAMYVTRSQRALISSYTRVNFKLYTTLIYIDFKLHIHVKY